MVDLLTKINAIATVNQEIIERIKKYQQRDIDSFSYEIERKSVGNGFALSVIEHKTSMKGV